VPHRKRRNRLAAILAVATVMAFGAPSARADSLTVFAAASLKNALDEIGETYERQTGTGIVMSFAGSSVLARQIRHGAPADIFISANPDWMDLLEQDGLIDADSRFDLTGNTLVMIASGAEAPAIDLTGDPALDALIGDDRLAMALVDAVPAGIYGKAALQSLGQWDAVSAKIAQTDNVRTALALVATGAAPLGIVYATDAGAEDGVSVVGAFPAGSHPPIVYPAAAVKDAARPETARFLAFLREPASRAIFARHGFRDPG